MELNFVLKDLGVLKRFVRKRSFNLFLEIHKPTVSTFSFMHGAMSIKFVIVKMSFIVPEMAKD